MSVCSVYGGPVTWLPTKTPRGGNTRGEGGGEYVGQFTHSFYYYGGQA